MDSNSLANPYVNLYLIDRKGHSVSQSQNSETKFRTLDPVFEETFTLWVNNAIIILMYFILLFDSIYFNLLM